MQDSKQPTRKVLEKEATPPTAPYGKCFDQASLSKLLIKWECWREWHQLHSRLLAPSCMTTQYHQCNLERNHVPNSTRAGACIWSSHQCSPYNITLGQPNWWGGGGRGSPCISASFICNRPWESVILKTHPLLLLLVSVLHFLLLLEFPAVIK